MQFCSILDHAIVGSDCVCVCVFIFMYIYIYIYIYCSLFGIFREDLGFKIVCEQVSHHPPVTAFHGTSKDYTIHGAIHPKLKFWGKSIEVTPKGMVTLILHQ